jgi:hypothetical protein
MANGRSIKSMCRLSTTGNRELNEKGMEVKSCSLHEPGTAEILGNGQKSWSSNLPLKGHCEGQTQCLTLLFQFPDHLISPSALMCTFSLKHSHMDCAVKHCTPCATPISVGSRKPGQKSGKCPWVLCPQFL